MSRNLIYTNTAPAPVGPYSQAVQTGNLLFISGQIPLKPENGELVETGFADQCHQVLKNLEAVAIAGGSSMGEILKVTIFMTDLKQFAELNQIYAEYFDESKPARACVEVSALPKGSDVEMEAVALITE